MGFRDAMSVRVNLRFAGGSLWGSAHFELFRYRLYFVSEVMPFSFMAYLCSWR